MYSVEADEGFIFGIARGFFFPCSTLIGGATFSLLEVSLLEPLAFLLRHLLVAAGEGELLACEALLFLGLLSCRERVGNAVSG